MEFVDLSGLKAFLAKLKDLFATQESLSTHVSDTNNPHNVTAAQLGLSSVYQYRGSVASYSDLPTDAAVGDVYNVETAYADANIDAGDNVAWTGEAWDNLSGIFDTKSLEDAVDDAIVSLSVDSSSPIVVSYTKGDGTTATVSGEDVRVEQNPSTDAAELPVLTAKDAISAAATDTVAFSSGVTVNPSAGSVTAKSFIGDLTGTASSAEALGSADVGSGINPIYLAEGVATASAETVGSADVPVYLSDGAITASTNSFSAVEEKIADVSSDLSDLSDTVAGIAAISVSDIEALFD